MHTDGHWTYEELTGFIRASRNPDDQRDDRVPEPTICEMVSSNPADGRLIAAAPAMLQALRELVAEYDEQDRQAALEPGCGGINPTGGIEVARATLARLDGEEVAP